MCQGFKSKGKGERRFEAHIFIGGALKWGLTITTFTTLTTIEYEAIKYGAASFVVSFQAFTATSAQTHTTISRLLCNINDNLSPFVIPLSLTHSPLPSLYLCFMQKQSTESHILLIWNFMVRHDLVFHDLVKKFLMYDFRRQSSTALLPWFP